MAKKPHESELVRSIKQLVYASELLRELSEASYRVTFGEFSIRVMDCKRFDSLLHRIEDAVAKGSEVVHRLVGEEARKGGS